MIILADGFVLTIQVASGALLTEQQKAKGIHVNWWENSHICNI